MISVNKWVKWGVAAVGGSGLGFAYWYFVGCNSGSCAITSSPINSSLYGALMGVLLLNTFSKESAVPGENKESK